MATPFSAPEAILKAAPTADPAGRPAPASIRALHAAVDACRACPLWRNATQGVAGEGPARAQLMLVGEQPGDQEDLAGRPFVGPAGKLLDRALEEAGLDRQKIFVTNAVKHFKHEMRGKRRLHKRPNTGEIQICRWWLANEIRLARPKLIVALGASAARSVFGRAYGVAEIRGKRMKSAEGFEAMATIHPSLLLRIPDREERARELARFTADLKKAGQIAAKMDP